MREALIASLCLLGLPLLLAGCSPFTLLNGADGDARRVAEGVPYGSLPAQRLDVYAPPGAAGAPVVVFFYGGSWRNGSRGDYAFVGAALAGRGIVTMVADYRRYPEAVYPAFVADSAQAVAWALAHAGDYGGDPRRVFVAGHSAGAYNAAMVALDARWLRACGRDPSELAGWVGMAGPYEFLPLTSRALQQVFPYPDTPADTQPLAHVSADAPPTLLLAGRADTTVDPRRNTDGLAAALGRAGVPVRLIDYPRLGHGMLVGALARPLRWRAPVLDDLAAHVQAAPAPSGEAAGGAVLPCSDTGFPQ